MTVGGIVDWLLSNSVAIGSVVAFILLIVKVSRKLDTIQRVQTTTTTDMKEIKDANAKLTTSLNDTTSKLSSLENSLEDISERLKVSESAIMSSRQDRSELRTLVEDLRREVTHLETNRSESTERTMITLQSIRASLIGLVEVGADGPVKQALANLDDYLFKKGSE